MTIRFDSFFQFVSVSFSIIIIIIVILVCSSDEVLVSFLICLVDFLPRF